MTPEQRKHFEFVRDEMHGEPKQEQCEPKQEEYLSKAYRLANELRCHLAIAPAPQQRTWVGLTDEEWDEMWIICGRPYLADWYNAAEAISAKLKEKNT